MAAYAQDTQLLTRRSVVFLVIVALHSLIVGAFATGLARKAIDLIAPPIQADVVQEVEKKDEPPPPPPPQLERPPVEVPPPDVTIDLPAEAPPTAILDTTDKHIVAPPPQPAPVHHAVVTLPKMGKGFPNTEDYYPSASQRLGESGAANVKACVGTNGRLTSAPTIDKSSGSSRLDEGALRLAKAGDGKYSPATEDGKPIEYCFVFKVTFQLK
jgi:periplasmic protein TonB